MGNFNIVFNKPGKRISISVYTVDGRKVYEEKKGRNYRKGDYQQMDLRLSKGVYFVRLKSGPNSATKKVVVN